MLPILGEFDWNAGTITILGTFAVPICAILGGFWFKSQKLQSDNELKRTMVQRGMSVEEIERVLAAKSKN